MPAVRVTQSVAVDRATAINEGEIVYVSSETMRVWLANDWCVLAEPDGPQSPERSRRGRMEKRTAGSRS